MDVLTVDQHRALAFIAAANAGGYEPQAHDVEAWLREPEGGSSLMWIMQPARWERVSHISIVAHLSTLGWTSGGYGLLGLRLTPLGRSLLQSADADEDGGAQVVLLDSDDPLAYPTLIGQLADLGDALIVDPYLDLRGASDLLLSTGIRRALVSDSDRANIRRNRAAITTLLGSGDAADFEVRATDGLHDRMVVADDGRVWTIGASLNGVQRRKSTTVLTTMPDVAAEVLARQAEEDWERGNPLIQRDSEEDEREEGVEQ